MSYNPYWGAATLIQNAIPSVDVPQTVISTYNASFGPHTSSYSTYVASPALYIDTSVGSAAVDVTYTTPGYITASPIVGAIYNPLVSIVEPIVSPSNTVIITQPEVPLSNSTQEGYTHDRGKRVPKLRPTPEFCDICKVTCATKASVYSHFSGSLHKKKAAQLNRESSASNQLWKCELCSVSCTSVDSFYSHINGNRHLKKVDECQRLSQPVNDNLLPKSSFQHSDTSFIGEEFIEKINTCNGLSYKCTLCDCEFTDSNSRTLHLKGRRHRLAYKQKHDPEMFVEMQPSKRLKSCLLAAKKRLARKEAKNSRLDNEFKIWEAEQRQLESEWNQYREEERWYRYIEGIKRQEEEHRQWYIQERQRCERMGIPPPPPPPRPRPPPPPPARDNSRKLLNNHDASLIHTKHSQLQPNKTEIAELEKLMKLTEDTIELISEELDEEYMQTPEYKTWKAKSIAEAKGVAAATSAEEPLTDSVKTEKEDTTEKDDTTDPTEKEDTTAATAEEQMDVEDIGETPAVVEDDHLVIKSCIRIGDLPKHSIMKSKIEGILAVFCVKKPTVTFFEKVFMKLKMKFAETEDGLDLVLACDVQQVAIFIKRSEPVATELKVNLTSAVFREEEANDQVLAEERATRVLDRKACLDVLGLLRQSKWFESRMSVSLIVVLQLLKDLNKRIPAWSPLTTWALELVVERCARTKGYSSQPPQFSPPEVLRRVFELFASGFLLLNTPGLNDPCEKEPVDVLGYLSDQEREDLTASAQYALRLMVYNQLYKILGIAQPAALKNPEQISRSTVPGGFKQKA